MNDHDGVLTHLDEQGAARMVDVSAKAVTLRRARASGAVLMKPSTLDMISAIFHRACEAVMPGGVLAWESLALSGAEAGTASAKRRVKPGEPACLLPADFTVVHEGQGNCDSAPSRIMIARRSPLPGA